MYFILSYPKQIYNRFMKMIANDEIDVEIAENTIIQKLNYKWFTDESLEQQMFKNVFDFIDRYNLSPEKILKPTYDSVHNLKYEIIQHYNLPPKTMIRHETLLIHILNTTLNEFNKMNEKYIPLIDQLIRQSDENVEMGYLLYPGMNYTVKL